MNSIRRSIGEVVVGVVESNWGLTVAPSVVACKSAGQGDYQVNNAMGVAKVVGKEKKINPKEVAEIIKAGVIERGGSFLHPDPEKAPSVAGPGFINIHINPEYISSTLKQWLVQGDVPAPVMERKKVVVDFSSPNMAKEMHVGHLRSSIIGESICRILEYCGHDVTRLNHVGDWGTQFGMLIAQLKDEYPDFATNPPDLKDLAQIYKDARAKFDAADESDPNNFKTRSQLEVVALQSEKDAENTAAWKYLVNISIRANQVVYDRLGVVSEIRGESWYNDRLPQVVKDLDQKGITEDSNGAKIIWVFGKPEPEEAEEPKKEEGAAEGEKGKAKGKKDKHKSKGSAKPPLMLVKSDGGYNYATTDMAALQQRSQEMKADRLVYVVDAGQASHFELVFGAGKMAGWLEGGATPEHVKFGLVCGDDGKKLATRKGQAVLLGSLLDEAAEKCLEEIKGRKMEGFSEEDERELAELLGTSCVKYQDLSFNRLTDYKFNLEEMVSLKGNTAVYLLYTYARIRSIGRKAELGDGSAPERTQALEEKYGSELLPSVSDPAEMALAKFLVMFLEVIEDVHVELYPHKIAEYLYALCQRYTTFYENCPVIKSEEPLRSQRLLLCESTALVIKKALFLLGIKTVEKL